METLTEILAVITGFALRLAIPIAITAIAVYFLRKLDARWQTEADEQPLLPVVEKPECWDAHNCPLKDREMCPGYQSDKPCWQAFRSKNGHLQEKCIGCDVFEKAPMPTHS